MTQTAKNISYLRESFSPFSKLDKKGLEKTERSLKIFSFKKKQIIHREGFSPSGLFIIKIGKVKIYKTTDTGKQVIIHIAGEKEMVGFSAILRKSEYHFWAEAIENSELIFIPKKVIYELIEDYPPFSVSLMVLFFKEFDNVIEKLVDLLSDQVRKRTAKVLLWLIETYGMESDRKTIAITLSRKDLANLAATNTETLVRNLSDFKKEKLVALRGKKISIINFEKLNQIVFLP